MFKSDFHSVAQLSQVVGKASVLFIRDYLKFIPEVREGGKARLQLKLCVTIHVPHVCVHALMLISHFRALLRMMCMCVRVATPTRTRVSKKSR